MTLQTPSATEVSLFRQTVYAYYRDHPRVFPWRETRDPYAIVVSEIMLQQTRTTRVAERYDRFLQRFPDFDTLARSRAADVLREWQGLGYNRRALALLDMARMVQQKHGGRLPSDHETLVTLPGIGPYTASAIRVFAFDQPAVVIETNIRTAFIHHFFPEEDGVSDGDLAPFVDATVDEDSPRTWYYALMDYGAMLKRTDNAARRSIHHRRQSSFEGSRRQARSVVLRMLLAHGAMDRSDLVGRIAEWDTRYEEALETLRHDGLVVKNNDLLQVAD